MRLTRYFTTRLHRATCNHFWIAVTDGEAKVEVTNDRRGIASRITLAETRYSCPCCGESTKERPSSFVASA
jgi:hypothetical protein